MKKLYLFIALALVALISTAVYIGGRHENTANKSSQVSHADSQQHPSPIKLETDGDGHDSLRTRSHVRNKDGELDRLRRELKEAKVMMERITRPLGPDALSSTVNAQISPGETLVTGGYKTADGNYEVTFLIPRSVTLSDGSEGYQIQTKVLSVGPEFMEKSGMGTLATNTRNTHQHAEVWQQDDMQATFRSASKATGVSMMTAPSVTTPASSPFVLEIGEEGGPQFSVVGKIDKTADGNFAVQTRIERSPRPEEGGLPNP